VRPPRRCRPLVAAGAVRCHGGTTSPVGPASAAGTSSRPSWHRSPPGCGAPGAAARSCSGMQPAPRGQRSRSCGMGCEVPQHPSASRQPGVTPAQPGGRWATGLQPADGAEQPPDWVDWELGSPAGDGGKEILTEHVGCMSIRPSVCGAVQVGVRWPRRCAPLPAMDRQRG